MTAMRAVCPRRGRVGAGAPCVLPFLQESLRGVDAGVTVRLITLKPSQNWSRAKLFWQPVASARRQTDCTSSVGRHWSAAWDIRTTTSRISDLCLLLDSEALEIHSSPFFSWLLKRLGKNLKMQVVWGVSGVNSGKCQNNWETSFKPWSHLNSALEVTPANCFSKADGEGLQAVVSSCQHPWQALSPHWRLLMLHSLKEKGKDNMFFWVQHHQYTFKKFRQWKTFGVNKWIQEAFW